LYVYRNTYCIQINELESQVVVKFMSISADVAHIAGKVQLREVYGGERKSDLRLSVCVLSLRIYICKFVVALAAPLYAARID